MLGTDYILSSLAKENIDHLFMVPGGLVDPFLPAIGRQKALRPIIAAKEGGAAMMADGYARASGKFGVALCIGGPGLTNTVTAVATAQTDGAPLLLISGETATYLEGRGMFQDASSQTLDDVGMLKGMTRYSTSIDSSKNLPHLFTMAMIRLLTEPAGPVHLSLPKDAQAAAIDAVYQPMGSNLKRNAVISRNSAELTLERFTKGKDGKPPVNIAILAGAGVEHAACSAALLEFAERYSIPVATTLRAKGVFPEDHPLSLGVFGYAGTHHSKRALLETPPDLLLILGSGLNERDSMHWTLNLSLENAISVNLSPLAMGSSLNAKFVLGDAGAYLAFLKEKESQIAPSLDITAPRRKEWLQNISSTPRYQEPENCLSDAVPIHPARIIQELRKALPRDGIVLIDSGAHRAFAGHYWTSYAPLTYISATNLGPMGWAIPASLGVQCAKPHQKVAVITGDGCMHMEGMEIATAARYKLPVVFVVINNSALGNVWLRAHQLGPVPDALTKLPDIDWAGFSRSLGGNGITVKDPKDLSNAFEKALQQSGPTVIDVKADKRFKTPVDDFNQAAASWSYHE